MQILGSILVMVGIIAMAGSGGDCDGACSTGNDIGTMLLIAGGGLACMMIGAIILIRENW